MDIDSKLKTFNLSEFILNVASAPANICVNSNCKSKLYVGSMSKALRRTPLAKKACKVSVQLRLSIYYYTDSETNKIFNSALDIIVADQGYSRCIGPFTLVTPLSIRRGEKQLSRSSANQTRCITIVRNAVTTWKYEYRNTDDDDLESVDDSNIDDDDSRDDNNMYSNESDRKVSSMEND
ncbi:unnamed protein product [Didymodactylos carnosus]|uniref:Uncharacterized protein n=1 Tax=Didymodactylos carnosus TaxID=1234261 RepID=A0A815XQH6_9BILA|nr:unnamed protein product [Didymodactylos carnosus]CAF1601239.1 unnamed protein product [Didymodactylos carnosus]CAF4409696.1 unnamed protein product [Didymodactylos carnosus]CAF4421886.1 unnamed protein product [Didymodactylos carnosus]